MRTRPDRVDRKLYQEALAKPEELGADSYPRLDYLPLAALMYDCVPVVLNPQPPEYVYVKTNGNVKLDVFISEWNAMWDAAEFRHHIQWRDERPDELSWLDRIRGRNVQFLPYGRTGNRYSAHEVLFGILPQSTRERFGLPLIRKLSWPAYMGWDHAGWMQGSSFDNRLSAAFAHYIWPHLDAGSPPSAFSSSDPIKLLAHNLDFWIPHANGVAEQMVREIADRRFETSEKETKAAQLDAELPNGVRAMAPTGGAYLCYGEAEARAFAIRVIERADQHSHLRALLDAIRSHRVQDDFSDRWSFAREDFERKLYSKRSRIRVSFVELDAAEAVHGTESDLDGNLVTEGFLGLLNEKDRRIVVCLMTSETNLSAIAKELGYANHSAVSKRLSRIRKQAKQYFA